MQGYHLVPLVHLSFLMLSEAVDGLVFVEKEGLTYHICAVLAVLNRGELCSQVFFLQQRAATPVIERHFSRLGVERHFHAVALQYYIRTVAGNRKRHFLGLLYHRVALFDWRFSGRIFKHAHY